MNLALQLPARDAQQWLRLRQLRVQRARQALAGAQAPEREAQQAVQARQQRIEAGQAREDAVDATLQDRRRHLARSREHQAELDAEDASRLPPGAVACRA